MATTTPDFAPREERKLSFRDVLLIVSFAVAWGALQMEVSTIKEDVQFIKQQLMTKGMR